MLSAGGRHVDTCRHDWCPATRANGSRTAIPSGAPRLTDLSRLSRSPIWTDAKCYCTLCSKTIHSEPNTPRFPSVRFGSGTSPLELKTPSHRS